MIFFMEICLKQRETGSATSLQEGPGLSTRNVFEGSGSHKLLVHAYHLSSLGRVHGSRRMSAEKE